MAGHHAQQTAGAPGNRGRGTQKRWRMGKSNYKEGQHEREFKDEGRLWRKIEAWNSDLSKSEGVTKTVKNETRQNSETVPHRPQRQRGRQKIERENARRGPCQSDRRVKQWAGADSSGQILCYRKKMLVKTRKRKKAGVFAESCRVGGYEGHIMCLISSGSKSEATSFLSHSVSLYVDSACLFVSVGTLQKCRGHMKNVFQFSSS